MYTWIFTCYSLVHTPMNIWAGTELIWRDNGYSNRRDLSYKEFIKQKIQKGQKNGTFIHFSISRKDWKDTKSRYTGLSVSQLNALQCYKSSTFQYQDTSMVSEISSLPLITDTKKIIINLVVYLRVVSHVIEQVNVLRKDIVFISTLLS